MSSAEKRRDIVLSVVGACVVAAIVAVMAS